MSGTPREADAGSPATGRTFAIGVALTAVVLVAAGFLAVRGTGDTPDADADPAPTVERGDQPTLADRMEATDVGPLPAEPLEAFGGDGEVAPDDYRGKPLVVNFWASWCAPCVEEMPDFQEIADAGEGQVAVLGVNLQDEHDRARALADSLDISYDLAVDPDGRMFEQIGGFGMPTTLFVDAQGEVRHRYTGPLDAGMLRALLEEHLGVEV